MNAGRVIREARQRAKLTQEELARRLSTSQPSVARWEAGRVSPRAAQLDRVVRACGMRLEVFLLPGDDRDQDLIDERLRMTPGQRLNALLDGLAWERMAHLARPVGRSAQRLGNDSPASNA